MKNSNADYKENRLIAEGMIRMISCVQEMQCDYQSDEDAPVMDRLMNEIKAEGLFEAEQRMIGRVKEYIKDDGKEE